MGIFFTQTILNMSLTASIIILCVMAARLLLKKAPKIYSYALWAVVLFRLLCPISFTAPVSVLEATKPQVTEVGNVSVVTYRYVQRAAEDTGLIEPHIRTEPISVQELQQRQSDPKPTVLDIASCIWIAGMVVMGMYNMVVYFRLHRQLAEAVVWKRGIYLCDHIPSPFVLGLFCPRIYLPSDTPMKERRYIIAHERHHIRRCDHFIKWLAYIALCVHWFNPLVWAAFILAGKDMEMSCDEAVIKKLGEHIRGDYSASLLRLATGRRVIAGTPLAFGEGDTKGRVRNMASWRKPKVWVSIACMFLCIAVLAACAVNPDIEKAGEQENTANRTSMEVTIENDTVSYGELTLTIPENYAARLDEDGSVILSRDNIDVGGITHWSNPNPEMPYATGSDISQWVADLGIPEAIQAVEERKQQEQTGEIPEEPIAFMIEGGGDSVTAWFMNELHPEKLNKEHNLFVTKYVVYDIWHDENVQTDAEVMEYLKTMRIAGEPTWMTEVEETGPTESLLDPGDYHNAFTSTDGTLDITITANIPDEFGSQVEILDAVPHYLTEAEIQRAARAIFGQGAYFTERAPEFVDYHLTEKQLQDAIDRMEPYTDPAAWTELCGTGGMFANSPEESAETTRLLVEEYQNRLANFRNDYPEQECQWTLKNAGYYTEGYPVEDLNDNIEAYVEKDGISYSFTASVRDAENFKINNIHVLAQWPSGMAYLDERILYRDLCRTEPTAEQISSAKMEANRVLQEMDLGNWIVDECYVEVIGYHDPDAPEYVIHANAVPALSGGPEIRFGQRSNINQNSQEPTCSDNYYLSQAEFEFAPGGQLLRMSLMSPMDLRVNSTASEVWSLEDMLKKAEEELSANNVNDFGLNVDEWGYTGARCRVDVNNIRVGMARIRVRDTEESYRYIPAMALYGSRTYLLANGEELETSEDDVTIMTINALDGSLIQDFNEVYDQ